MIQKEVIDNIRDASKVEDVVGEFVTMKKRGVNYLALCPFHDEKTPSFTISPAKNIYKCFGCGKSGDSVQFLMDHEHYTYPEALKYLAKKYGIEVEEEEITPEQQETLDHRESIYAVLSYAEKYYKLQLDDEEFGKPIGQSYLVERQISPESIETFGIGISPKGWDTFTQHALQNAFKEEFLVAAGLTIKRDNGQLMDRFRERIMFPIHSVSGRTLGFGGRILKQKSKKDPKYINSPDTDVYNKSEVLYGLHQAKKAIRTHDICYLVEGYTDVISLHQNGIENVVASSGTSLTQGQLKLVHRNTTNICFLFDGDTAGVKASLRAIDLALEEGLNVFALQLPEGEDPDTYAKSHDQQELKDYLETEKQDFIIFKTELLLPGTENDPLKKTEAITDIVGSIALIPNQLKRTVYIQQCSQLLKIDEESLVSELNKYLSQSQRKKRDELNRIVEKKETEISKLATQPISFKPIRENEVFGKWQEKFVVEFLLKYGDLQFDDEKNEDIATHIFQFMDEYDAEPDNEELRTICDEYRGQRELLGNTDIKSFLHHDNNSIRELSIDMMEEPYVASENWVKRIGMEIKPEDNYLITVNKVMNRYKLGRIQQLIWESMQKLRTLTDENLLTKNQKIQKRLFAIRKEVVDELGIVLL